MVVSNNNMGIPSYFSHIVKKHRKILREYKLSRMTIHNLYLDCNSFIYDSIHELNKKFIEQKYSMSQMESDILILVCNKIVSQITDLKTYK